MEQVAAHRAEVEEIRNALREGKLKGGEVSREEIEISILEAQWKLADAEAAHKFALCGKLQRDIQELEVWQVGTGVIFLVLSGEQIGIDEHYVQDVACLYHLFEGNRGERVPASGALFLQALREQNPTLEELRERAGKTKADIEKFAAMADYGRAGSLQVIGQGQNHNASQYHCVNTYCMYTITLSSQKYRPRNALTRVPRDVFAADEIWPC